MKRKLFNSWWVCWVSILMVSILLSYVLFVSLMASCQDAQVGFINIRSLNLEGLREHSYKNESFVTNQTPVFFLGKEFILVGTVESLIHPGPKGDVFLQKSSDITSLEKSLFEWKFSKEIFPSRAVVFSGFFPNDLSRSLSISQELTRLMSKLNDYFFHEKGGERFLSFGQPIVTFSDIVEPRFQKIGKAKEKNDVHP